VITKNRAPVAALALTSARLPTNQPTDGGSSGDGKMRISFSLSLSGVNWSHTEIREGPCAPLELGSGGRLCESVVFVTPQVNDNYLRISI